MATNLDIDKKLLDEAMALGGHRTKRAVVVEALEEYIRRRRQTEILELFGSVDYGDHDHKKQRHRG